MSYHIYTTNGIILKRTPFGEANVLLHILTEDLGLIMASAQAARLLNSKLGPALQEHAFISLSCIKSKNGWKITSVVEEESFFSSLPQYSKKVVAQIGSLLLKMITGESPHPEIFQTVQSGFKFLKSLSEKDIPNFEILAVLRILHQLGYVASGATHTQGNPVYINSAINKDIFLSNPKEWSDELLQKVSDNKPTLVSLINKGLKESHL